ncbi:helix-turn-helix transcriptional regulator [Actinacidiphila sp. DG2A-62]|uniref:helix-turn-helix transcriptional regulator n=1 Tax=Actinacidiphila sp. DG2A-62 TaxID=3108821 RepID=UPI002DBBAD39|nr:helix-turn-helix transcriptional regulator [Actinacidiphila sp. DG2A-62]MEC3992708.1 helix-turn-helix transcriptional regulator [Actinacidiphila sp. DG2A-62]
MSDDRTAQRPAQGSDTAGESAARSPAARAAGRRLARRRRHRTVLACRRAHRSTVAQARDRARARAALPLGGPGPARGSDAARPGAAVAEADALAAVIDAPHGQLMPAMDALFLGRLAGADAPAAASPRFDAWYGDREDGVPVVAGGGPAVGASAHGEGGAARGRPHRPRPRGGDRGTSAGRSAAHQWSVPYGLALLLGCLDAAAGRAEHTALAARPAGQLPWNAHFAHLAAAVLAGREGDCDAAEEELRRAVAVAASCPPVRHLGLGLVARTAARDGWGEPIRWLQEAERFYSEHALHPAARHCRDQLRALDDRTRTRQRRPGSGDVPEHLWSLGVTVREFDVLTRLGRRRTNREIAAELHLSHRTVERHVANLLEKTHASNRRELAALLVPERKEPAGAQG